MKVTSRRSASKFKFSNKKPQKGRKKSSGSGTKSGSNGGVKSPSMFVEHRNR